MSTAAPSEQQLEQRFPWITWRRPIPITVGTETRLGCRLCIAIVGLKAANFRFLPATPDDFEKHMQEAHP